MVRGTHRKGIGVGGGSVDASNLTFDMMADFAVALNAELVRKRVMRNGAFVARTNTVSVTVRFPPSWNQRRMVTWNSRAFADDLCAWLARLIDCESVNMQIVQVRFGYVIRVDLLVSATRRP